MKKLSKYYFLRKIVKMIRKFKKNPKEVSFLDKPIKLRTIEPENRGHFDESTNYYQRMKNH